MQFEEFKTRAIAYVSRHGAARSKQIMAVISPNLSYSKGHSYLVKLTNNGDLIREQDPSSVSICYLYKRPSSQAVEPEVIDSIPDDVTWGMVMNEITPFAAAFFRRNTKPRSFGQKPVIEVDQAFIKIAESKRFELAVAIASVCGGTPKDYQITFVPTGVSRATAVSQGTETVEKSTAPVVNSIPEEIKSEFSVKPDGSTTVTLRGAERLLGISHQALSKALSGNQNGSKLAKNLISKGFQVATFGTNGIPDIAFGLIVTYYAFKSEQHCTAQAEAIHDAFEAIGVRTWIQNELGWKPANTAIAKQSNAIDTNLSALVMSIQGLATTAQSQQAMILDQQSAMREIVSGLNQIGQSLQSHGNKINELDSKVIDLEQYVSQREAERQQAMQSILGVNPTVQAPPKEPRRQLIHLVDNYCYHKGLGKDGRSKTWAQLYRDIELRCRVSLEVERKKLLANGQKQAKKIDAVESLGLIDTAVAIAYEVLKIA